MPTARRDLTFSTLDRVMPDVDRLLTGYSAVGHWTLGQVCNHLSKGVVASVDGFKMRTPWIVRGMVGPAALAWILRSGRMPTGIKAPSELRPPSDLDDRAEVEALRAALSQFASHTGPMAVHPLFGKVTRDQIERVHCLHCAHHLSFILPSE